MEHLKLEIFDLATADNPKPTTSKYAVLEEDASITITDTSEIFASGDVWSYSFTLNVYANAHIFGTSGDLHGSRLHEQVNKRRARLWVDGLPLYLGYLKLDDEVEVDADGNVDVGFESGKKTFDEMIEGAKANQVPMMNDVKFGVALWRKRYVNFGLWLTASASFSGTTTAKSGSETVTHDLTPEVGDNDPTITPFSGDGEYDAIQEYPRMVFPKGEFWNQNENRMEPINCLNTDYPYTEDANGTPTHPYCNVALCYQKYGYHRKDEQGNETDDYSSEPEAQRAYEVMPANRVNSAPNFFVIYWLRCLMQHLGIYVEENQMMDVEDLRRLFFVNTKCEYRKPKHIRNSDYDRNIGRYTFMPGKRLVPERLDQDDEGKYVALKRIIDPTKCGFGTNGIITGEPIYNPSFVPSSIPTVEKLNVVVSGILGMPSDAGAYYQQKNGWLHDAIASSDCFPDVDISSVISAIENGFGVRFLFSDSFQRVRIVLLRDLFKDQEIQTIDCEIRDEDTKTENCIRGFRMTYGDTEDTQFYYKGFADKLPHKKKIWPDPVDEHDYSQWDLNASYSDVINKVSAFDKTCYVTPNNGDAYIIKVDKDAKRYEDLHPSLFECAGYMDAEDGDCTGEDETIQEISMGFKPAIMNDVNYESERDAKTTEQQFALFVDAQMRPRRFDYKKDLTNHEFNDPDAMYDVDGGLYNNNDASQMMTGDGIVAPGNFCIASDMHAVRYELHVSLPVEVDGTIYDGHGAHPGRGQVILPITFNIDGHVNEGYRLYLQDNFEPNDDGVAPVEAHDWGLTLGIMRGSGSDASVNYIDDPDDEENDSWEIIPGSHAISHPDTCDSYGNEWDYNGQTMISSAAGALAALPVLFPNSNAPFNSQAKGYITHASIFDIEDDKKKVRRMLIVMNRSNRQYDTQWGDLMSYLDTMQGLSVAEIMTFDAMSRQLIVETDSSYERASTLAKLCGMAYGGKTGSVTLDNGVGSTFGRFSLKLRAEKLNPYFDPSQEETHYDPEHPELNTNPRYLTITNENLRQRGLCDTFYKEYSYWVRNARIVKRTVVMTLAQYLAIDKTKKVRVGDITGFIRKRQCSFSNKTGMGEVTLEIMYI